MKLAFHQERDTEALWESKWSPGNIQGYRLLKTLSVSLSSSSLERSFQTPVHVVGVCEREIGEGGDYSSCSKFQLKCNSLLTCLFLLFIDSRSWAREMVWPQTPMPPLWSPSPGWGRRQWCCTRICRGVTASPSGTSSSTPQNRQFIPT